VSGESFAFFQTDVQLPPDVFNLSKRHCWSVFPINCNRKTRNVWQACAILKAEPHPRVVRKELFMGCVMTVTLWEFFQKEL